MRALFLLRKEKEHESTQNRNQGAPQSEGSRGAESAGPEKPPVPRSVSPPSHRRRCSPRSAAPDYYAMMRELYRIGNSLNQVAQKAHMLNVVDVQRYDAGVRQLEAAIKKITEAVILPQPMEQTGTPHSRGTLRGEDPHGTMSLLTLAAKAAGEVWYDNMAVTSIWRIQGSFNQVVRYVKNPEKTGMPGTAGVHRCLEPFGCTALCHPPRQDSADSGRRRRKRSITAACVGNQLPSRYCHCGNGSRKEAVRQGGRHRGLSRLSVFRPRRGQPGVGT